jgi:DnaJ-class molecular chaperone
MPDQKPNAIKALVRCERCKGTGRFTPPEEPEEECRYCKGEGYDEGYYIDMGDVVDTINDIKNKCDDIYEKVNE